MKMMCLNARQMWLILTLLVAFLLEASCSDLGDDCIVGKQVGVCKRLRDCDSIVKEIKEAGSPMPSHIRRKLQEIRCGFENDEPLICCALLEDGLSLLNWLTNKTGSGASSERPIRNDVIDPDKGGKDHNGQDSLDIDENSNKKGEGDDFDSNVSLDLRNHQNYDLLPTDCGSIEDDRIWGGNRTRLYEMPWMVLIAYESARGTRLSCGGTLISEYYVLTAAHCVAFLGNRLKLSGVVLGEYDVRQDPDCERVEGKLYCAPNIRNVTIDKVIPHPGYSPKNFYDDIALIRLSEPADFSLDTMKPICLPVTPQLQQDRLEGITAKVSGWGATEDGLQSSVLLSVSLPIVSNQDCEKAYRGSPRIYDGQMCAGGVPDKDSCGGDSGGPLIYPGSMGRAGERYVQRGIVSYGSKRCGIGGFPGVYTRVGYYMTWILNNMEK